MSGPTAISRRQPRASALAALSIACGLATCVAADSPATGAYRPDASLERLQHAARAAPQTGRIRDFELTGDTMYLLDRGDIVHVLHRSDGAWHHARGIGRTGSGPGEFRNAAGLTVDGSGAIVVAEAGRIQVIRPDGTVERTFNPELPCSMMLPGVTAVRDGLFVFGNCVRRGHTTDTMKAVLAWTPDGEQFRTVAEEISFTTDGTVGSVFSAQRAFTAAEDGNHQFGSGFEPCLSTVTAQSGAPVVSRRCGVVRTRYTAPAPPEFERRARAAGNVRLVWPDALPAYIDRVRAAGTTFLLRPFAADSLVIQTAAPHGRDMAVAPLNGFIGCKARGCLWMLEDTEPMRMILLETEQLESWMRNEK